MKLIIFLLIVTLILSFKSNFKIINNGNNVLILACHIKKKYGNEIINNNLSNILNDKINLIIVVYSSEIKFEENLNNFGKKIVYIHDTENKYYDFYKYHLAYKYLNENNINFKWVLVTNDSFIITENVSNLVNEIITSNKDYIGILETSDHILSNQPNKKHYQSWWLNFRKNTFEYFNKHLIFNEKYNINKSGLDNIINDYEINLSNDMINKFDNKSLFPNKSNYQGNIFYNDQLFNDYYFNKNFKFVKIKTIKKDLIPKNLKRLFN